MMRMRSLRDLVLAARSIVGWRLGCCCLGITCVATPVVSMIRLERAAILMVEIRGARGRR